MNNVMIADYINPEIITFNPSFIKKKSILIKIESNNIYVKRRYTSEDFSLLNFDSITLVTSNPLNDVIKFKITKGDLHGFYMLCGLEQQIDIYKFVELIRR